MVRLALFPRLRFFFHEFFKQKLKFFITKAPLAFVCNPLARSAGIFFSNEASGTTLVAQIGSDTSENKPSKISRVFPIETI